MLKLSQLDMVRRFNYESGRKNPYIMESVKYLQTYIDIFSKATSYHTEIKLREDCETKSDEKVKKLSPEASNYIDHEYDRQVREVEARSIRKYLNFYLQDENKEKGSTENDGN